MNRRGVFRALLGAPFVAKTALNEGVLTVMDSNMEGPNSVGNVPAGPMPWYRRALLRIHDKLERKRDVKGCPVRNLPPHISERKSWSTPFKQHVLLMEREAEQEIRLWDMTDAELLEEAMRRGLKP